MLKIDLTCFSKMVFHFINLLIGQKVINQRVFPPSLAISQEDPIKTPKRNLSWLGTLASQKRKANHHTSQEISGWFHRFGCIWLNSWSLLSFFSLSLSFFTWCPHFWIFRLGRYVYFWHEERLYVGTKKLISFFKKTLFTLCSKVGWEWENRKELLDNKNSKKSKGNKSLRCYYH